MPRSGDLYRKALAAAEAVEYIDFGEPDIEQQVREVICVVLEYLLEIAEPGGGGSDVVPERHIDALLDQLTNPPEGAR